MQAGGHQLTGHVESLGLRAKDRALPLVRGEPGGGEELLQDGSGPSRFTRLRCRTVPSSSRINIG